MPAAVYGSRKEEIKLLGKMVYGKRSEFVLAWYLIRIFTVSRSLSSYEVF
jgi:hypothetical protein